MNALNMASNTGTVIERSGILGTKARQESLWTLGIGCLGLALCGPVAAGPNNPDAVSISAVGTNYTLTGEQIISADGTCSRVWVNIKGEVTGTTDDGNGLDNVTYELWDDGTLKDSETLSIPVDSTILVDVTLEFEGLYLTGAAGVGVYESETGLFEDPYYPTDVPGVCSVNPVKCWVSPNIAKRGSTVVFSAEIPNGAKWVKAYNGDLAIATLTDPDGDYVFSGNWKVPTTALPGWHRQLAIKGMTLKNQTIWCLGVNVQ